MESTNITDAIIDELNRAELIRLRDLLVNQNLNVNLIENENITTILELQKSKNESLKFNSSL